MIFLPEQLSLNVSCSFPGLLSSPKISIMFHSFLLKRFLSLLECQSKSLLQTVNLPVQRFIVLDSNSRDREYSSDMLGNAKHVVIKAQVPAGGRGKGYFIDDTGETILQSGVHVTPNDTHTVNSIITRMLGNNLVTKQSTNRCNAVMIAEAVDIQDESYLALLPHKQGVQILMNRKGGVNVESEEEGMVSMSYDTIGTKEAEEVAEMLALPIQNLVLKLFKVFKEVDATLLEINPLAITSKKDECDKASAGDIVCVDAKIEIDDASAFRHPEYFSDKTGDGANYIQMDGNVGCLVNGAGLAMATMDILSLNKASPANFLDIGGTATVERVSASIKKMLEDEKVESIYVNVFGGIVRGDVVAGGILDALNSVENGKRKKPVVVRLVGSNCEVGQEMLRGVPNVILEPDFEESAKLAVHLTKQRTASMGGGEGLCLL